MGAILGGMLIFYLLGKILEWTFLNRVFSNRTIVICVSSFLILLLLSLLWYANRGQSYAQPGMLVDYFVEAILLPLFRMGWSSLQENRRRNLQRKE